MSDPQKLAEMEQDALREFLRDTVVLDIIRNIEAGHQMVRPFPAD
jgi:hypothetical protein